MARSADDLEEYARSERLAEYAIAMNKFGTDSLEANEVFNTYRSDVKLAQLMRTSYLLKKALTHGEPLQ